MPPKARSFHSIPKKSPHHYGLFFPMEELFSTAKARTDIPNSGASGFQGQPRFRYRHSLRRAGRAGLGLRAARAVTRAKGTGLPNAFYRTSGTTISLAEPSWQAAA